MRKLSVAKGQKFVDKKGRVWEVMDDPKDEKIRVFSASVNQEMMVAKSVIKSENWKKINPL